MWFLWFLFPNQHPTFLLLKPEHFALFVHLQPRPPECSMPCHIRSLITSSMHPVENLL